MAVALEAINSSSERPGSFLKMWEKDLGVTLMSTIVGITTQDGSINTTQNGKPVTPAVFGINIYFTPKCD